MNRTFLMESTWRTLRRSRAVMASCQRAACAGECPIVRRSDQLAEDSVANVSLIVALDKRQLVELVGKISRRQLELVLSGIDVIVGR